MKSRGRALLFSALALVSFLFANGCSDEIVPTGAYSKPESIPAPTQVLARPSARGALITWAAPDSDFIIVQGWLVYKRTPDGETTRVTPKPVTSREYEDRREPQVGITRYWVTALSRGNVESLPSSPTSVVFDEDPPAAPTNLRATPEPGHVILLWDTSLEPDVNNYTVYRDGLVAVIVNDPSMPIYFDFDVVAGRTYTYVVTATDFRGHESGPSNAVVAGPQ